MMKAIILGAAAGAAALALAPGAAAALPAGDYGFDIAGGNPRVVHVESLGFETIKLTTPSGFKINMAVNRAGTAYVGKAIDSHGVVCAFDGKPHPASVFYTFDLDGKNGITEVTGEPCGPGLAIAPLAFTLTPAG